MKQHHKVDGNMVTVQAETRYRIRKGTLVHLVIDGADTAMVTEKAVFYTRDDIKAELHSEYHFYLPANNRRAEWLIVKKDDVNVFERHQM